MNHSLESENHKNLRLEGLTIHITSYDVSRKRRLGFMNRSDYDVCMLDNGLYPATVKVRGYVLKSECAAPAAVLNDLIGREINAEHVIDCICCELTRIKDYEVRTDLRSDRIECDIEFCCSSYISEVRIE